MFVDLGINVLLLRTDVMYEEYIKNRFLAHQKR